MEAADSRLSDDAEMKSVLFLCTGNYYRSRFAEIMFNWLAEANDLPWRATSRGLNPDPRNLNDISRHVIYELNERGIPMPPSRAPQAAVDADFQQAALIVAVREAEHRPMMDRKFPAWAERIRYWHIHDLDVSGSNVALAELEGKVHRLVDYLVHRSSKTHDD